MRLSCSYKLLSLDVKSLKMQTMRSAFQEELCSQPRTEQAIARAGMVQAAARGKGVVVGHYPLASNRCYHRRTEELCKISNLFFFLGQERKQFFQFDPAGGRPRARGRLFIF